VRSGGCVASGFAYTRHGMSGLCSSAGHVGAPFGLHGAFSSTDLDEVQSVVAASQHPISVDPAGPRRPLRFGLHHHPLSRMALTRATLEYEGSLKVSAPPLEHHYFLRIPLRGSDLVLHGSKPVRPAPGRVALLLSPGNETTMRSTGGFDEVTVEISAEAIGRAWRALTGETPSRPIVFEPSVPLTGEAGSVLLRIVPLLADEVVRCTSQEPGAAGLERLEDALLFSLLDCQPHSHDHRHLRRGSKSRNSTLVRDAEAWMEVHCEAGFTIQAVAEAHDVTIRTLQRAFERYRAYSPKTFLHRLMLGRARTRLRSGAALGVTEVAMTVGFRHLGRFSVDYRKRYGEPPSSTLRRTRRRGRLPTQRTSKPFDDSVSTATQPARYGEPAACGFCLGDIALV
jgi:AraC-like DNA-binding protein